MKNRNYLRKCEGKQTLIYARFVINFRQVIASFQWNTSLLGYNRVSALALALFFLKFILFSRGSKIIRDNRLWQLQQHSITWFAYYYYNVKINISQWVMTLTQPVIDLQCHHHIILFSILFVIYLQKLHATRAVQFELLLSNFHILSGEKAIQ